MWFQEFFDSLNLLVKFININHIEKDDVLSIGAHSDGGYWIIYRR